jgi:ATP phosphoribosyltransferase regulatory subunit
LTFTDLDGKLMALRPDVTLSIVKRTKLQQEGSEKLYYTENVYRAAPSGTEYKETYQIGLEYIGRVQPYTSLETVSLAVSSLRLISEKSILSLSHTGFLSGLFSFLEIDEETEAAVRKCICDKNRHGITALCGNGLTTAQAEKILFCLDISGSNQECLKKAGDICENEEMENAVAELSALLEEMQDYETNLQIDFSIPSDVKYYNGLIFCGYVQGVSKAVLSGGRYDNLMEIMGKKGKQAIGFALYFDELERFLNTAPQEPLDAVILYTEKSPLKAVNDAVSELTSQGKTVWADVDLPQGRSYKKIIAINEKGEREEKANA